MSFDWIVFGSTNQTPLYAARPRAANVMPSQFMTKFKDIVDSGFNMLMLAFMEATTWDGISFYNFWCNRLDAAERRELINYAHGAGALVIVSAGGQVGGPAFAALPAADAADVIAAGTLDYDLDGFDDDVEAGASHMQWHVDVTNLVRAQFDAAGGDRKFITHAPECFCFYKAGYSPSAPSYFDVVEHAGHNIDWYLIQFYNQGTQ